MIILVKQFQFQTGLKPHIILVLNFFVNVLPVIEVTFTWTLCLVGISLILSACVKIFHPTWKNLKQSKQINFQFVHSRSETGSNCDVKWLFIAYFALSPFVSTYNKKFSVRHLFVLKIYSDNEHIGGTNQGRQCMIFIVNEKTRSKIKNAREITSKPKIKEPTSKTTQTREKKTRWSWELPEISPRILKCKKHHRTRLVMSKTTQIHQKTQWKLRNAREIIPNPKI